MLTLCRANGKARVEFISPQRAQRAQGHDGKDLSSWSSCPLWLKTGLTRRALGQPTRRVGARGLQVDFATESTKGTKACRNGFFFAVYVFFVAKNPFGREFLPFPDSVPSPVRFFEPVAFQSIPTEAGRWISRISREFPGGMYGRGGPEMLNAECEIYHWEPVAKLEGFAMSALAAGFRKIRGN